MRESWTIHRVTGGILAALLAGAAHGQVSTYTGASAADPANWCEANNWFPVGVPPGGAVITIGEGFARIDMFTCTNDRRILGPISTGSPVRFWTPVTFSAGGALRDPAFELSIDPAPISGVLAISGSDAFWRGGIFSGGQISNLGIMSVETTSFGGRQFPRILTAGCELENRGELRVHAGFELEVGSRVENPGRIVGLLGTPAITGSGELSSTGSIEADATGRLVLSCTRLTLAGDVLVRDRGSAIFVSGVDVDWTGRVMMTGGEIELNGPSGATQRIGPLELTGDGQFVLNGEGAVLTGTVRSALRLPDQWADAHGFWFSSALGVGIEGQLVGEGAVTWTLGDVVAVDPQRAHPHIDIVPGGNMTLSGEVGEPGPGRLRGVFVRNSGSISDFSGLSLWDGSRVEVTAGSGRYNAYSPSISGDGTGVLEVMGTMAVNPEVLGGANDTWINGTRLRLAGGGRVDVWRGFLTTSGASPVEMDEAARASIHEGAEWRVLGRAAVTSGVPTIDGTGRFRVGTGGRLEVADGAELRMDMRAPGQFKLEGALGAGADDPGSEGFFGVFENSGAWDWNGGEVRLPAHDLGPAVINSGTLTAYCSGCRLACDLLNSLHMRIVRTVVLAEAGAELVNEGTIMLEGGIGESAAGCAVRNRPTGLLHKVGAEASNIGTALDNTGEARVSSGTLSVAYTPQISSGTLTDGSWVIAQGATLRTPSQIVTSIFGATVDIQGSWPELRIGQNRGTVSYGGTQTSPRTMINYGAMTVQPDGTLRFTGAGNTLRLDDGSVILMPGSTLMIDGAALPINGGTLGGTGRVAAPRVENWMGTIRPGFSPGMLTLDSDYTQGPGGTLEIEVAGPTPGEGHDVLVVGGDAVLDGTLRVALTGGFVPAPGQTFAVLTAQTRAGQFLAANLPPELRVVYTPTAVILEGVARPCPADFDGDGFLDFFDAAAFVACFEGVECPPGRDADFDGDGFVDFIDVDGFVAAFEAGC